MSDDPAAASILDRVNTLSAPAVVGLGAAAGLLLAILSALSVEPSASQDLQPSADIDDRAELDATVEPGAALDAGSASAEPTAGGGQGNPDRAGADGNPDGNPDSNADADADANVDADAATDGDAEPEDVVLLDPDVGGSAEVEPEAPDAEDSADSAGSEPPPSPAGRSQSDRDAEAKMDADELLTAATAAYEEKRYKDAFRLATRSQRSRPRDKAQMLRGRSACRLRDEKNAREIVRSFKLGDEHRKTLRTFCKDRGVRVGL